MIELVLALVAILVAAILFTNAVELLGERLGLAQGATGSVLAAVGTALPETTIPIVAILGAAFTGTDPETAGEIGVGAILGAPFLLATLAMFLMGVAAIGYRNRRSSGTTLDIDTETTRRDLGFFLGFYALAILAGILALPGFLKVVLGIVLVTAYVFYVVRTIRAGGGSSGESPEKLRLWPGSSPAPTWAVAGQLVGALGIMIVGARFFVDAVESGAAVVGVPAGLVALILAPLATELPEKVNSILWIGDGKDTDTLAVGNITGAMVFQSTIPVAIGIMFTPWALGGLSLLSAGLALAGGALLYWVLRRSKTLEARHLLVGGAFYAVFLVTAVVVVL